MRYLKLEAGWILTNLAYGSDDEMEFLVNYQQGNQVSLIHAINYMLENNHEDLQMVD